jgi:hypothetical protein
LSGFTLENGSGTWFNEYKYVGGGIYCHESSPTVENNIIRNNKGEINRGGGIWCYGEDRSPSIVGCIIENNSANNGGGIHTQYSDTRISNCKIRHNYAAFQGGGIFFRFGGSPGVTYSHITQNIALQIGGGIRTSNSPYCTIDHNHITYNKCDGTGGGVEFSRGILSNNIIKYNMADVGGGVSTGGGANYIDTIIFNNVIANNLAIRGAGGANFSAGQLYNNLICFNRVTGWENLSAGGGLKISSYNIMATLFNSIIYENYARDGGGGCFIQGNANVEIINCTIVNNNASKSARGIGLFCQNKSRMDSINSIYWNDPYREIYYEKNSKPSISYSNIQGGWNGPGNINEDPMFVSEEENDYHILFDSPCKDTGYNSIEFLTENDFENDPRIAYDTIDMGADEFYPHLYVTGDEMPGGSIQGKLVGLPSTSPVGLFLGSGVIDPPFHTPWGDFYLQAPWLMLPLVPIPTDGILVLPATIPFSPHAPYDLPMQALIGLNHDSLTNLEIMKVR